MIASGWRRPGLRRPLLALLALAAALGAGPAVAQRVSGVDPLDILQEMRLYMRTRLPSHWWYEDPRPFLNGYQMVIHIAKGWAGNPTSAMLQLCPPQDHRLWGGIERLNLLPMLNDLPRPGYDCLRPPGLRPRAAEDGLIGGQ